MWTGEIENCRTFSLLSCQADGELSPFPVQCSTCGSVSVMENSAIEILTQWLPTKGETASAGADLGSISG